MSADLRQLQGRMAAQERVAIMMVARVEELVEAQEELKRHVDARFDVVNNRFDDVHVYLNETRSEVNTRFDEMKAQMAAMEDRILDAYKQFMAVIDSRLPPHP